MNPRYYGSCGLTDGEATERFWSVIGEASKCTKEMTESNRHAYLDDLLRLYTANKNSSVGNQTTINAEIVEKVQFFCFR